MALAEELRVGICGCSDVFRGQLEGRQVTVPSPEHTFNLREIPITSGGLKYRAALKEGRCHFFLDVHPTRTGIHTELELINLYPCRTTQSDHLWIAAVPNLDYPLDTDWFQKTTPSVDELIESIPELVLRRGEKRFENWLRRMTPKGWVLPIQEPILAAQC